MSHEWALDAEFFAWLCEVDEGIGAEAQAQGCQRCELGGRLHRSDYPRKPRGVPVSVEAQWSRRVSFRCNRCRLRTTPASVRYLGRRVYAGAVLVVAVVFAAAARALRVPVRTVGRWRLWWKEGLSRTAGWRERLRAQLPPGLGEGELPEALLAELEGELAGRVEVVLRWLSPLTAPSARSRRTRDGSGVPEDGNGHSRRGSIG